MTTPLICGTMVHDTVEGIKTCDLGNSITNMTFNRKLRMLRADLFTLISTTQISEFFSEGESAGIVKNIIINFVEGEFNNRAK